MIWDSTVMITVASFRHHYYVIFQWLCPVLGKGEMDVTNKEQETLTNSAKMITVTILSLDIYEVNRLLILEKDRWTNLLPHQKMIQGFCTRQEGAGKGTVSWEIKGSYSPLSLKEPWLFAPLPLSCSSILLLVYWSHDFFPYM